MTETPFPSADELLDKASLVNGDMGAAQDELIRRLSIALPPLIEAFNARNGLVGVRALPVPKSGDFEAVGAEITDKHIGKTLVGIQVVTGDMGPGAFKNTAQVEVFSIDRRVQISARVGVLWKRAELVRLTLFPYLTGCDDPQGRRVWRQLIPTGYGPLPQKWEEFSGTTCTFNLVQPPNMNV